MDHFLKKIIDNKNALRILESSVFNVPNVQQFLFGFVLFFIGLNFVNVKNSYSIAFINASLPNEWCQSNVCQRHRRVHPKMWANQYDCIEQTKHAQAMVISVSYVHLAHAPFWQCPTM